MAADDLLARVAGAEELDWDVEVDVLVIGCGGCGLIAALSAAQAGASVLVVEKEERAGGNTSLSQGMIPAAGTRLQKEAGVEDSPEWMAEDILAKNHHESDPDLTRRVAEESGRMVDWLTDDLGVRLQLVADFLYPGHSRHRIHAPGSTKGTFLVNALLQAASQYGEIDIAYNAPAERLIARTADGAVLGAEVNIEGVGLNRARAKATVLALNGFGANEEMVSRYIPEMAGAYYFGHEGNTGEGILWGRALGAELKHMSSYQSHGSVAYPHGTLLTWAVISLGGYQVNTRGQRFVNEDHGYSEHALDVLAQPGGVAVELFDERIYKVVEPYEDFQKCVEMGAVKRGDSIEAIAAAFGLDADALRATHEDFQGAAREGAADAVGRTDVRKPLAPPFYGVKVTGALFHTQGGLRVDEHGRVVHENGRVIPNLYAGGGTAAGFSGNGGSGYLSANGLLAALTLGRLAGKHAGKIASSGE
jgi:fumarate reductase flavoprotein subunit